jgi:hypothetical protein
MSTSEMIIGRSARADGPHLKRVGRDGAKEVRVELLVSQRRVGGAVAHLRHLEDLQHELGLHGRAAAAGAQHGLGRHGLRQLPQRALHGGFRRALAVVDVDLHASLRWSTAGGAQYMRTLDTS